MTESFNNLGKRITGLQELPEELKSQLQITKMDDTEEKIICVIKELYDGMANIDEILVGIYKKHNEIYKRQFISNKLYRMAQSKLVYSVNGKKGAYCTEEELQNYYKE